VILAYHRVDVLPTCPYPLAVSPRNFARQMEYIRQSCQPLPLLDLVTAGSSKRFPRRAVVITFDDGYVDVYTKARPILDYLQIPATIFVTVGNIDTEREFWWDELERIFLLPPDLPKSLRLCVGGEQFEWELNSDRQRREVRHRVHRLLRPLDAEERQALIGKLLRWAGLTDGGRSGYRTMTSAELIELSRQGLFEIGGHTVTHPVLSTLAPAAQRAEIINGRRRLEALTGRQVQTFSYPYGSARDYDEETVEILRSAGFVAACTTQEATLSNGMDYFRLPRYGVGDWDISLFRKRLEHWFTC
jgi:peptidoglycan/xylan/chitin deacetylase (PgdA/CDA1 family)